jgi:hypothetical protein
MRNISTVSTIWVAGKQMMQDVHMKLNPGFLWQKQHSAKGRLLSPADWT